MPPSISAWGREQKIADLVANRQRLETESDKLLAAHFANAIDLPTLKRHQDRIRAGLADVIQKLAEHQTGGHAFLHDSLRLLTDAQRGYACSNDDSSSAGSNPRKRQTGTRNIFQCRVFP